MFSTDGLLTSVFTKLTGAEQAQSVLSSKGSVYWFQTFLAQWKTLGWNSIIYLAAIAGIDQQQYEAAKVDGAGYFQLCMARYRTGYDGDLCGTVYPECQGNFLIPGKNCIC